MAVSLLSRPKLKSVVLTSPVGGLNSVSALADMPPTDCISLINLIPSAYGVRTRLGSTQWVIHVGSTQATGTFTPPTSGTTTTFVVGWRTSWLQNTGSAVWGQP